jgi:hypothetical protein
MKLLTTVMAVLLGVIILLALLLESEAQASDASLAFCSLYARESARIELMHAIPVSPQTITDDYIEALAVKTFKECLSVLPTLLPLPEAHRNLTTWVADMKTLLVSRAGTEPAMAGDAEWREACARTYRTWNEDTGMVIRKGSPEPVRCPCGTEVVCE